MTRFFDGTTRRAPDDALGPRAFFKRPRPAPSTPDDRRRIVQPASSETASAAGPARAALFARVTGASFA